MTGFVRESQERGLELCDGLIPTTWSRACAPPSRGPLRGYSEGRPSQRIQIMGLLLRLRFYTAYPIFGRPDVFIRSAPAGADLDHGGRVR